MFRAASFESLEDRTLLAADFAPGEIIVRFTPDTSQQQRENILAQEQISVKRHWDFIDAVWAELPDADMSVEDAVDRWQQHPKVVYAEPNMLGELQVAPNDTRFPEMYGLDNTGQTGGTPDADIDAPEGWDIYTGSDSVIVAVFDSGTDYNHPDLMPNMWVNPGEVPGDGVDNDGNGYVDDIHGIDPFDNDSDPMDAGSHGTHVSGTIAAQGNNGLGTTGVAWDAGIMSIKICAAVACSSAAAVTGYDYILDMKENYGQNVRVTNHSWGGFGPMQSLSDAFNRGVAAGIVNVAAAGNSASDNDVQPFYPSEYADLAVAATDHNDDLAGFSQFGATSVDIGAPGEAILSTEPNSSYGLMGGTSMASPHVAGAAALVAGLAPGFDVQRIVQIIKDGADQIPSLNGRVSSNGRLNIFGALSMVESFEVRGTVWHDERPDGIFDTDEEVPIEGWTVYLDLDDSGTLDQGEPEAVTDVDGNYTLESFTGPGTYTVAQVLQTNWEPTVPSSGTQTITVINRDDIITDIDFGNRPARGSISGIKWNDLDGDGRQDPDEPGLPNFIIWVDMDDNHLLGFGEPAAVTQADGTYHILGVAPGDRIVREVLNPGWVQTFPAPEDHHVVTVLPAEETEDIAFGNQVASDFGDAPLDAMTLSALGGASHGILNGLSLGEIVDNELDGFTSPANATGDDLDGSADEDGVTFATPLFAGGDASGNPIQATVEVFVQAEDLSPPRLHGWIDFDQSGTFDADEKIISNKVLTHNIDGNAHEISFAVPVDAQAGPTYARFRLGYEYDLGPTGHSAFGGEVEDYLVLVLEDQPVARDDAFIVDQDSANNVFDVITCNSGLPGCNADFESSAGPLRIVDISLPDRNGIAITADGQNILYSPAPNFSSPPFETFTYTVEDPAGNRDTATVTVTVRPRFNDPIAVDDVKRVIPGTQNNIIDVLANDTAGTSGPLTILPIPPAEGPQHGTVTIDNNGTPTITDDDFLRYTPGPTFADADFDQFTYTISNTLGVLDSAVVTIFEQPVDDDKEIIITLDTANDTDGDGVIEVGENFDLILNVEDRNLRANDPFNTFAGAAAVYLDLLYNQNFMSVVPDADPDSLGFQVDFGEGLDCEDDGRGCYTRIQSGDANTPYLINEVGAFQTGDGPIGADQVEVFRIRMSANVATQDSNGLPMNGTNGTVRVDSDPADISPAHDILVFEPPRPVTIDEVDYGFADIAIVAPANTSPGTSGFDPDLDINDDGFLSPLDALLLINSLNTTGPRSVAEGEAGGSLEQRMDVNKDGRITPLDALMVINGLNGMNGEGEGLLLVQDSSTDAGALPLQPLEVSRTTTVADGGLLSDTDPAAALDLQPSVDVPVGAAPTEQQTQLADSDRLDDEQFDSLLDELAADVLQGWLGE